MNKAEKEVYEKSCELFNNCCALCGSPYIQLHHVYEGKNRKKSTKYGMIFT